MATSVCYTHALQQKKKLKKIKNTFFSKIIYVNFFIHFSFARTRMLLHIHKCAWVILYFLCFILYTFLKRHHKMFSSNKKITNICVFFCIFYFTFFVCAQSRTLANTHAYISAHRALYIFMFYTIYISEKDTTKFSHLRKIIAF